MSSDRLEGALVNLRPATEADVAALVAIRAAPEVRRWWRGGDLERDTLDSIAEEGLHLMELLSDDLT